MKPRPVFVSAVLVAFLSGLLSSAAQTASTVHRPFAAHVVFPPVRSSVFSATPGSVGLVEVSAAVGIVEQVATTTLDVVVTNTSGSRVEAEVVLPVPDNAVLRGFTFQGAAAEPTAELLAREQARGLYDSIVARTRDPALLEFAGCNLIRSSVFPVEARGAQKLRIVYEQVCASEGDRVDYVLPRTESIEYHVPWQIAVKIASKSRVGTVYSPSHGLETVRTGEGQVTARVTAQARSEPGPFRLSYLVQRDGLSASLLAYPESGTEGGYFLLFAGPPSATDGGAGSSGGASAPVQKREVILVLDRSGSMGGQKLEQARAAALQVLEGLEEGEAFNVVIYSDAVESFAAAPVIKTGTTMAQVREFLRGIRVNGGTNIHDALMEALRQRPTPGYLPLVLFLTDGLPTVGKTSERAIREVATRANPHGRRLFTFGVGADVNTPLLDRLASETRAISTYVLPGEDVEARVGQVFRRLNGPTLAEPVLRAVTESGEAVPGRLRDVLPGRLPDLFEGDQLVVLGRYSGSGPLLLEVAGATAGRERRFRLRFDLGRASTANAFVPRLWASRKIAELTDSIRDLGVDAPPTAGLPANRFGSAFRSSAANVFSNGSVAAAGAEPDPKARELVSEVIRLSREYGILTEYTAFLAREGTDLSQPSQLLSEAYRNFSERAMNTRWGNGAVNQSLNNNRQLGQAALNFRNGFLDANLMPVQIATVQQVNDRAFYRRNGRWVDSRLVGDRESPPGRTVEIGSEDFRRLVARLASENRSGTVSLGGEILLQVDGETVLVR